MARSRRCDAAAILRLRAEQGLTQLDLALEAGVEVPTVYRAEAGQRLSETSLEALARALCRDVDTIAFPEKATESGQWWIPRLPSPFFVGRGPTMRLLSEALYGEGRVALVGPAGVGKSEIALQFAYREQHRFHWIFWIEGETPEATHASLRGIAPILGLRPEHHLDATARHIFTELARHDNWLLILDEPSAHESWWQPLPSQPSGRILLTTTDTHLATEVARTIQVGGLTEREATDLLLLRSKSPIRHDDTEPARELARQLGYLPGVLETVAAFVATRRCTLRTYLAAHAPHFHTRSPNPWRHTLAAIDRGLAASGDALRLLSVSGSDTIPTSLLETLAGNHPSALETLLRPLLRYSALKPSQHSEYHLHPLLRRSVSELLTRHERRTFEARFLEILEDLFPRLPIADQHSLATHAKTAAQYGQRRCDRSEGLALLVLHLGLCSLTSGQLADAAQFLKDAAGRWSALHGTNHTVVAQTLNNLGIAYDQLGKHSDAKRCFARAARIFLRLPKGQRLPLREVLHNRATAAFNLQQYKAAERFTKQCLRLSEPNAAPAHWDNLGVIYEAQGRYEQAISCYRQAITLQSSDPKLPDFVRAHRDNNLGKALLRLGQLPEAKTSLERAARRWRRSVGDSHPAYASALNNLGELYLETRELEEAERHLTESLRLRRSLLPPHHRHLALTLVNLSRLRALKGERPAAFALARRAKAVFDAVGYHAELVPQLAALRRALGPRSQVLRQMLARATTPPVPADLP